MKLKIPKSSGRVVGALRVPNDIYEKLQSLAKKAGVSMQEIVRHILAQVIDEVEV